MNTHSNPAPGYRPRKKIRWGTLALILLFHVLVLFGLGYALAPKFTASAVETIGEVLSVTITTPEDPPLDAPPEPDEGAEAEAGEQAVPREVSAPEATIIPRPVPLSEVASTGSEIDAGAQDQGDGTGADGEGLGTGSGNQGSGQGSGIAERPSVRSGELNQARDFPIPEGGRRTRFGKSVTVFFTVTTDGRARDCSVGSSGVDQETTERVCPLVIEKIRFNPARRADGTPVEARYGYRVDFLASD